MIYDHDRFCGFFHPKFSLFFVKLSFIPPPCNFHVIMHALKKIVIIGFEFSRAKKEKKCVKYFFYYHMKISPPFSTFLSIFKWQNVWTHAKLKSRYYYKLFRFVKSCSSRFFSHFTLQQKAWFFNLWGHAPHELQIGRITITYTRVERV